MSLANLQKALAFTLHWEGDKFTNNPNDLGGATRFGLTQRVYDAYRISYKLSKRSVALITIQEVKDLYQTRYWSPSFAYNFEYPLGVALFDTAVAFNPQTFKRFVCNALGIKQNLLKTVREVITKQPSWFVTNEMLTALKSCDQFEVALSIAEQRFDYREERVRQNPTQAEFLKGWQNRDRSLENEIRTNHQVNGDT